MRFGRSKFFGGGFTSRLFIVILFVFLSITSVSFSLYLFTISGTYYMLVIASAFLVLSAITGFFNSYAAYLYYKSYFYLDYLNGITKKLSHIKRYPKVAVIMAIRNEDSAVVKRTLTSLKRMRYPKGRIRFYLGDMSDNEELIREMGRFCKSNNITYVRTKSNCGKAGVLNKILKVSGEEYIAIFDYDERLTDKNFFMDLLPYFEDEKLAYVQTEKTYMKGSLFSDSVSLFDEFFFKFIEPARSLNNTAIYAGSCGIIRRSVLDRTRGFPKYVIEDTFFSFEADRLGYKGLYIPKVYAVGIPIKTFSGLSRQQWRYNFGDTEFLKYYLSKRKNLKSQWISHVDYLMHGFGLNYISVILICFTIVSIFIVFSAGAWAGTALGIGNISSVLEVFGSLALLLSITAPIILTKIYFKSVKKGIMIFALNYALAIIRAKAALAVFLNKNPFAAWKRSVEDSKGDMRLTLISTRVELFFSACIILLSYIAISAQNIIGGIWLAWYGFMYVFATLFVYKYG